MRTQELIEMEEKYGAHNYHPLDVVIERGLEQGDDKAGRDPAWHQGCHIGRVLVEQHRRLRSVLYRHGR